MAGQKGYGVIDLAVRDRNAGIGKPADTCRDARYDAERDAVLDQRQGFLATTPEDEGIATLQPQHPLPLAREFDQPQGNIPLLRRRLATTLARKLQNHAILCHRSGNRN